jgi:pyridoxamine 5'-phosphate oxidase
MKGISTDISTDVAAGISSDISSIRLEYTRAGLLEAEALPSAIAQFDRWFREALEAKALEANAVTLATATRDGVPSARIVLLKGYDERGFTFFTNYESAKGRELDANPRAAMTAFWRELERQVRITGKVTRTSREESEAYFRTRPLGSQLGAWASHQSDAVSSRAALDESFAEMQARFEGGDVPLPPFWGGYRLEPSMIEFWQGRPSRLHDRLRYTRIDAARTDGWTVERLSP